MRYSYVASLGVTLSGRARPDLFWICWGKADAGERGSWHDHAIPRRSVEPGVGAVWVKDESQVCVMPWLPGQVQVSVQGLIGAEPRL